MTSNSARWLGVPDSRDFCWWGSFKTIPPEQCWGFGHVNSRFGTRVMQVSRLVPKACLMQSLKGQLEHNYLEQAHPDLMPRYLFKLSTGLEEPVWALFLPLGTWWDSRMLCLSMVTRSECVWICKICTSYTLSFPIHRRKMDINTPVPTATEVIKLYMQPLHYNEGPIGCW